MPAVSAQRFCEIVMPVMSWVATCDNGFLRAVDLHFVKELNNETKACDTHASVTFFYAKEDADRGYTNAAISLFPLATGRRPS